MADDSKIYKNKVFHVEEWTHFDKITSYYLLNKIAEWYVQFLHISLYSTLINCL